MNVVVFKIVGADISKPISLWYAQRQVISLAKASRKFQISQTQVSTRGGVMQSRCNLVLALELQANLIYNMDKMSVGSANSDATYVRNSNGKLINFSYSHLGVSIFQTGLIWSHCTLQLYKPSCCKFNLRTENFTNVSLETSLRQGILLSYICVCTCQQF